MAAAPSLTEFHQGIADAHGISLYDRYSENEAADVLQYSVVSLRRIRAAGRIGCIKLSPRKIAYFGYQLVEILVQSVESKSCPVITILPEHSNLATTGSRSAGEAQRGIVHGLTPALDKHAALASAQRILKKPNKS